MAQREPLRHSPRRAAVLGQPVAHSLSPALHQAAYRALGLDGWTYEAIDVGVDGLPALLGGLDRTWAGLSVTMPLKHAVMQHMDDVSPLARAVGAVNTVVVRGSDTRVTLRGDSDTRVTLRGDNTDVYGMVAALREAGVDHVEHACVLGAGATGASAVAALRDLGCRAPTVRVRSTTRAGELMTAAGRLGVTPVLVGWADDAPSPTADVVISTVPAGAADGVADAIGTSAHRAAGVLLDAVYDPWPTPLATAWAAAGGTVVDGLSMLLHQAAAQVELFTGQAAPVEVMRAVMTARRSGSRPAGALPGFK